MLRLVKILLDYPLLNLSVIISIKANNHYFPALVQIFPYFQSWNVNIIQCGDKNLTRVPREIPMDATAVYLDRNKMSHLGPEIFLGRSKVTTLFLNNSNINGKERN